MRILITGGGGFIGGHLVAHFRKKGFKDIRAVDVKPIADWHQFFDDIDYRQLDLRELDACQESVMNCDIVYNLACDMGGMGFIENNKASCMVSVLINTHLLQAAQQARVKKYLFASSACVYAADKQISEANPGLVESDAYPAMPEDGYGWEKLFSERMCRHFWEDFGLDTCVPRLHNVYGPLGTWTGGREKAPAAICRKVIEAKLSGSKQIEIWGDGNQTRSFMYIDDCIMGIEKLFESSISGPINIGSAELVTINQLVDNVEEIAGVSLLRKYKLDAPKGVRGRSSDNTLIRAALNWEPSTKLRDGLEATYAWIQDQIKKQ